MPNGPASFLAPSSLGTREGGLTAWPPRQPEGHPCDLGTKAVLLPPTSPISLQRGLSGEGGPEPPRGLRDAVAVPHERRWRRALVEQVGRSECLRPEPPVPPPRRSSGKSCPMPKGQRREEPFWEQPPHGQARLELVVVGGGGRGGGLLPWSNQEYPFSASNLYGRRLKGPVC